MKPTTLIIGAGIAGLILARRLHDAGEPVMVLDKSRGVGGRMATKRVGPAVFDQGAQFFSARSPEFTALAQSWQAKGLIQNWPGGEHPRYVSAGGMTAVPKHLAEGLDLRREHKVVAVRRDADHWAVDVENQPMLQAGRLVLTSPAPQSLALLKAGGVALPDALAGELASLDYHPCLALLVVLDAPSRVPAAGTVPTGGNIRWLADNTLKGIAPGVPAALTVHTTPEFARTHYAKSEAEIAALLQPELAPWINGGIVSATLHRWRYSEPRVTFREPSLWLPELNLGLAGDAFGGPKVEGAVRSGLDLAARLGV
jgi:renalase